MMLRLRCPPHALTTHPPRLRRTNAHTAFYAVAQLLGEKASLKGCTTADDEQAKEFLFCNTLVTFP